MKLWKSFKNRTPANGPPRPTIAPKVDPLSAEFQAKAWAIFDGMMAAEKKRKEQFGEQLPIVAVEVEDGRRLVGVGEPVRNFVCEA